MRIRIALGIAPKYGPKKGITLVTPTITLTNKAYGVFKILVPAKQIKPIITESIIFPVIKPINVSLVKRIS